MEYSREWKGGRGGDQGQRARTVQGRERQFQGAPAGTGHNVAMKTHIGKSVSMMPSSNTILAVS
jgi:hypothetical protein